MSGTCLCLYSELCPLQALKKKTSKEPILSLDEGGVVGPVDPQLPRAQASQTKVDYSVGDPIKNSKLHHLLCYNHGQLPAKYSDYVI